MTAHGNILNRNDGNDRAWFAMMLLSAICHALFLSGMVFLPRLHFTNEQIPSSVEVDLVSLPASTPSPGESTESVPVKKSPPEKGADALPVKKPAVSEKTEADDVRDKPVTAPDDAVSVSPTTPLQVKRSVKKRTYNVSRVIDKAIAKIQKEAPDSRPRSVLEAIERLEKEGHAADAARKSDMAGVGTGGGMGEKTRELLDIYNAEIWHRIQKNWAFSEEMARGEKGLEGIVIMKIMRDGEIRDIWFEKRSGNAYFDDSVLKAIKKSNPLPPLPDGFLGPYYDVGVRFSPSELQGRR